MEKEIRTDEILAGYCERKIYIIAREIMSEKYIEKISKDFIDKEIVHINKSVIQYLKSVIDENEISEKLQSARILRLKIYETLNQIQHQYSLSRAIVYLKSTEKILQSDEIYWNPRQTGKSSEPDICVLRKAKIILSCELTTSTEAIGQIDQRMKEVLIKLSKMEGDLFYFVVSEKMKKRAETKLSKMQTNITVVNIGE